MTDLDRDVLAPLLADPGRAVPAAGGTMLKDSPSSTVAEFELPLNGVPRRVIYKRFRSPTGATRGSPCCALAGGRRSWVSRPRPAPVPAADRPSAGRLHRRRNGLPTKATCSPKRSSRRGRPPAARRQPDHPRPRPTPREPPPLPRRSPAWSASCTAADSRTATSRRYNISWLPDMPGRAARLAHRPGRRGSLSGAGPLGGGVQEPGPAARQLLPQPQPLAHRTSCVSCACTSMGPVRPPGLEGLVARVERQTRQRWRETPARGRLWPRC